MNYFPQPVQHKAQETFQTGDTAFCGSVVRHVAVFEEATFCRGMAVSAGRLYLCDYTHHVVDVVDAANGCRVTRYGTFNQSGKSAVGQPPQFYCPFGVVVDDTRGVLYVADYANHCVVVVRLCDGMVETVWGSQGSGPQQLYFPRGLAYCPATDLLSVVEAGNHCAKVLRGSDGQCVQVLGTGEDDNGSHRMNGPQGVAVDNQNIYITDTSNHRVVVYAKQNGGFVFQLGQSRGSGDNQFISPCGVSVDSEAGVVYVADYNNYRVCVYRSGDGSYVRHFQVLQADNIKAKPTSVMWDAASRVLYVTMFDSSTICVYPS